MRILSVIAGLFFGIWPLMMSRSGQNGSVNSVLFAGLNAIVLLPFALKNGFQPFTIPNALYIAGAVLFGSIGLIAFSKMLAEAPRDQLGWLCITMIVVQMMVPVLYQAILEGEFTSRRLIGLGAAAFAVWMLN